MSGMTLIVDRIGIIDQNALIDHGRDRFVDHRSRDSIFEKRFFDGLLSKSIFIPVSVGRSDITCDCLIRPGLKLRVLGFRCFTVESLVEGIDLGGLDETEFDEFCEGCLTSYLIGHIVSMILGDND